ncbi:MAG: hypothetical protein KKD35_05435 [Elusimicrobia bacterium]|nr:hypothetical protein [Elusimicrobiota bacterium]
MKTIKFSEEDFKKLKNLFEEYKEIFGEPGETEWDLEDLDNLRQIGEEFMNIVAEKCGIDDIIPTALRW